MGYKEGGQMTGGAKHRRPPRSKSLFCICAGATIVVEGGEPTIVDTVATL